jgi:hypothetical protein
MLQKAPTQMDACGRVCRWVRVNVPLKLGADVQFVRAQGSEAPAVTSFRAE